MSTNFPSFPILSDKQRFVVFDVESGEVALYEVRGLSVVNLAEARIGERAAESVRPEHMWRKS